MRHWMTVLSSTPDQYPGPCLSASCSPTAGFSNRSPLTNGPPAVLPGSDNAVHWILTGIDPATPGIDAGAVPAGATQQTSHFGVDNYVGPNTPAGETHRYVFTLYGLAEGIEISSNFSTNDTVSLIKQRIATGAVATIMGTHQG